MPSSSRYWNSPELDLAVSASRVAPALHTGLCAAAAICLWQLWAGGHPWLVAGLAPALCTCLWSLACRREYVLRLRWRNGAWEFERAGEMLQVELVPGWVRLPGLVLIRWRPRFGGRVRNLWLFEDALPPGALRLLCRRLVLEG